MTVAVAPGVAMSTKQFVATLILLALAGLIAVCFAATMDIDGNQRENYTRLKMQKIEQAAKTYRTAHDHWPELEELVTPEAGFPPLLEGGVAAILDAWGKRFVLEVLPDDTIRVSTTMPDGKPLRWPPDK